jgi:uncharacterized tellurite resistance protein B-like protein
MSLLAKLFGAPESSGATGVAGETEAVRRIVKRLQSLDPEKARYLAAFAYVLGRVAHADLEVSEAETRQMETILQRLGHLPEEQAVLVVEIAKSQNRLFGGTEGYLVTRELKQITSFEQRLEILDCLFEVSAADDSISAVEENLIRQIASELGLSLQDYVGARAAWSDKRAVLRREG